MNGIDLAITLIGTTLVLVALLVEIEHKVIWNNYQKHYHPHKNKLADKLLRPNKIVYILNVYVLWPLVFIMGLAMLYKNSI